MSSLTATLTTPKPTRRTRPEPALTGAETEIARRAERLTRDARQLRETVVALAWRHAELHRDATAWACDTDGELGHYLTETWAALSDLACAARPAVVR